MSEPAIVVRDLRKVYKVYPAPWRRLWELISRRRQHQRFEALAGISFTLPAGEGLAVIGENGAGKSTLLKILAGVTAASSGDVAVRGKVASILELGSGFHPEFSGRDNIMLNAAMLGLSEQEVKAKLPAIIEFSELGSFIEQPVKVYSTGMAMRLGFAIATQVEPDILIIDEALSVGDGYFQKKCMDRMQQFLRAGGTLLFCSHAMYYVSSFCQRALWMRHGGMASLGPAADVIREYESFLTVKSERAEREDPQGERGRMARLVDARLAHGRDRDRQITYAHLDPWCLDVEWETEHPELAFHLAVGVDRTDGVQVVSFSTYEDEVPVFTGQTRYRASLEMPALPLIKGDYTVYVYLLDEHNLHPYDVRILPEAFAIESDSYRIGLIRAEHRWHAETESRLRLAAAGR